MIFPLGSVLSYVLIDAVLALIALLTGFFGAMWYAKHIKQNTDRSGNENAGASGNVKIESGQTKQNNDVERTSMAALQLRDIARSMATDVGDHCALVGNLSDRLDSLSNDDKEKSITVVVDAVSQIAQANEQLQTKLADAESKIQAQAEELLEHQTEARTDALTQLANRRAFDNALAQGIEQYHKSKRSCSLLLFDVDHFKRFNDTHGHLAGDEVLRGVGKILCQVVPSEDLPCRYGGEEFAVVLRDTNEQDALVVAERVRNAVGNLQVEFEGKALSVTASFGLAHLGDREDSARLIRRADEAVYASKNAGRNCGHWHNGQENKPIYPEGKMRPTDDNAVEKRIEGPIAESSATTQEAGDGKFFSLPDRSVFIDELRRRISESHRFGAPLSLIYLRVQDYANLQHEYGDAVGSLVLDSVAQFINASLRDMDLLGRLEIGHFIVMLPGSSVSEAELVGNRVAASLANCAVPIVDNKESLELQVGTSAVKPTDEASDMISRAKRMMEDACREQELVAGR